METQNDLDQEQETEDSSSLILLFNQIPTIDEVAMATKISELEPIEGQVSVWNATGKEEVGWAFIEFDGHKLQLMALDMRVPESLMEETIDISHQFQDRTESMREHKVHVFCFYKGGDPDPVEQMIAMYKVASYFTDKGLLGVLDTDAWNCVPGDFVDVIFEPKLLDSCRESIPMGVWTNIIASSVSDDSILICTKGHSRFGVPDFALFSTTADFDMAKTKNLFASLFHYSRNSGAILKPGETSRVGNHTTLRFSEPTEFQEFLENTLILEKINI